jgi:hypothetical protein
MKSRSPRPRRSDVSEHYPRNMIGETVPAFCQVCQRVTDHRVDPVTIEQKAGKLGPCLEHGPKVNERGENKKQARVREDRERAARNPRLFPNLPDLLTEEDIVRRAKEKGHG